MSPTDAPTTPAPTAGVDLRGEVVPIDPSQVDLSVDVGGLVLPNPVVTASGCFASGREVDRLYDIAQLGAVVAKSITLEPRQGLPAPRMHETPSGMLNAIGLQNPGVDAWIEHDLAWLAGRGIPTIVSVAGRTPDEFAQVARRLRGRDGVVAIEVNLSCPNVSHRGLVFACDPGAAAEVTAAVCDQVRVPVFGKLTPDVTDVTAVARAVVDAGATGLSLVNTTLGMAVDPESGVPRLHNTVGGLSGPAIRPIAVRAVHQVHQALPDVPLLGMGGISSAPDVVEFVRVGASAVAVGTANFADPLRAGRLVGELRGWLARRGVRRLADLRGTVRPRTAAAPPPDAAAVGGT